MHYYVYILSSRSRNLYTGVTNNIFRRVWQHREGRGSEFTRRYRIHRLVYFERFESVRSAIAREKQIKAWTRAKRIALIQERHHEQRCLQRRGSRTVRVRRVIARSSELNVGEEAIMAADEVTRHVAAGFIQPPVGARIVAQHGQGIEAGRGTKPNPGEGQS